MRTAMNKLIGVLCVAACSLTFSFAAAADGLAAKATDLAPAERAKLATEIAAFKKQNPKAFQEVRDVQGYRPEVYMKFRNPVPLVGRELKRLGKSALLPMLEALAFQAPPRGKAADHEWRALKVGMLEAVGHQRDPRSTPVLAAIFGSQQHPFVLQTAAEALGALCDARGFSTLQTALGTKGDGRVAAIHGLGQCRTLASAKLLAAALDKTTSASEVAQLVDAMGKLGSSWAWRALGKQRAAESLEAREVLARALVRSYLRFDKTALRYDTRVSLRMVEHPKTLHIVSVEARSASAQVRKELDEVGKLIAKRTTK